VDAFEAERIRTDAVEAAIVADLVKRGEAEPPRARGPEKMWLLGAVPVEGLPRGSVLGPGLMDALRTRCWRFFVGMDDGGHAELDYRGGTIIAARHVPPGHDHWLGFLSRAMLLWARQTGGNNEARLIELPGIAVRAVRAAGPDPGVILDEGWSTGSHGMPMDEAVFVSYVIARYKEKRAAAQQEG
jgi:hypothetical protein